jgi:N utilization substance protein B
MTTTRDPRTPSKSRSRGTSRHSRARLAAIQALYQSAMTGTPPSVVIDEFLRHRLMDTDNEAGEGGKLNEALFAELVKGASARLDETDRKIENALPSSWDGDRLEVVLRCLLRSAAYELMTRYETPATVVISEYVRLAHRFFSEGEPAFANGVLDRLARDLRPGELEARGSAAGDATG